MEQVNAAFSFFLYCGGALLIALTLFVFADWWRRIGRD